MPSTKLNVVSNLHKKLIVVEYIGVKCWKVEFWKASLKIIFATCLMNVVTKNLLVLFFFGLPNTLSFYSVCFLFLFKPSVLKSKKIKICLVGKKTVVTVHPRNTYTT